MIEESATVIAARGGQIWVEAQAQSGCSSCSTGSCTTQVVGKLFGAKPNLLRLDNGLNARIGDRVVIGIPDELLVRASLLSYLAPVLVMLTVTGLAGGAGANEATQGLAALLGLVVGFAGIRWLTGGERAKRQFQPRLLRLATTPSIHIPVTDIRGMPS